MPYAKNKVIINNGRVLGRNADIHAGHKVLRAYTDEMEALDLLRDPEAIGFKEKLEGLCADYDVAQATYRDGCWDVAEAMRQFLDRKLAQKSPTP